MWATLNLYGVEPFTVMMTLVLLVDRIYRKRKTIPSQRGERSMLVKGFRMSVCLFCLRGINPIKNMPIILLSIKLLSTSARVKSVKESRKMYLVCQETRSWVFSPASCMAHFGVVFSIINQILLTGQKKKKIDLPIAAII